MRFFYFLSFLALACHSMHSIAAEVKLCKVEAETEAKFTGQLDLLERLSLGRHDKVRSGRGWASDSFAVAYGLKLISVSGKLIGPTQDMWFRDGSPECENLSKQGDMVVYLANKATFRFMTPEGKMGGSVLTISEDGGRTFSQNRYPGSLASAQDPNEALEHQRVLEKFGYHHSRMLVSGNRIYLELADPTFRRFLQFETNDQGLHWDNRGESGEPRSYPVAEVERWREQFALGKWVRMHSEWRTSCEKSLGKPCVAEVDIGWDEYWRACRKTRTAQGCLKDFVPPAIE